MAGNERSLFAVTIPARIGVAVTSVAVAHEVLKPAEVRAAEAGTEGRRRLAGRGFVRQGDWFFVPWPGLPRDPPGMRKRVRLGRGRGNPHVVDYLYGDEGQFATEFARRPGEGPVFARGFVRHREHRPINLRYWHRVFPNTAFRAPGSYND